MQLIMVMNKPFFSIKPWLFVLTAIFTVCAFVGGGSRYLRFTGGFIVQATDHTVSDIGVLFEHFVSGLGLTALFSILFTIIFWSVDFKQGQLSRKAWLASVLTPVILNSISIYLFESSQSEESVYGGLPRGYIQWDQVISGVSGVMMFMLPCVVWWFVLQRRFCKQTGFDWGMAKK